MLERHPDAVEVSRKHGEVSGKHGEVSGKHGEASDVANGLRLGARESGPQRL